MTVRDVRPVQSSPPGGLSLEERVLQLEQILANVLTDAAGNLILSEATVNDRLLLTANGTIVVGSPDGSNMEIDGGGFGVIALNHVEMDSPGRVWLGYTAVNGGFLILQCPSDTGSVNAELFMDERGVFDAQGLHLVVPRQSSDPTAGIEGGSVYYNTTSSELRYYNGSTWVAL